MVVVNIHELADEARNFISNYCLTECNGYCCRKGYIMLTQEEVMLLTTMDKVKRIDDKLFSLNLNGGCPKFLNNMCSVHNDALRSKTCRDFPIFVNEEKKEIILSPRCYAVLNNVLYGYIRKFMQMGYKIDGNREQ